MDKFLDDPDVLADGKHTDLIREMKIEAILSTDNSPYTEVRANVDPTDDPTMPSLTFRVWVLGVLFAGAGAFIDTFFNVRQPPVIVGANIAQLLACKSDYTITRRSLIANRPIRQVYGSDSAHQKVQSAWPHSLP